MHHYEAASWLHSKEEIQSETAKLLCDKDSNLRSDSSEQTDLYLCQGEEGVCGQGDSKVLERILIEKTNGEDSL